MKKRRIHTHTGLTFSFQLFISIFFLSNPVRNETDTIFFPSTGHYFFLFVFLYPSELSFPPLSNILVNQKNKKQKRKTTILYISTHNM